MKKENKITSKSWTILFTFLLVPVFFILDLTLGTVKIPFADSLSILFGETSEKKGWEVIIWQSRFPHAITAVLAGAALSVSGLLLQTFFRNPLAGPSVLGISSGASLGVALLLMGSSALGFSVAEFSDLSFHSLIIFAALAGALAITSIIIMIANRINDIVSILIAGMMIGYLISAVISILVQRSSQSSLQQFSLWGLGSFDGVGLDKLLVFSLFILIFLAMAFLLIKRLNLLLLGEQQAISLGVNIKSARTYIILISSVLAAVVTAYCGPIAFIGITVPHICRMILKTADHKYLLPAVIATGALLCSFCSIVSRVIFENSILPINAVTSLLGAPVILWIILSRKKST